MKRIARDWKNWIYHNRFCPGIFLVLLLLLAPSLVHAQLSTLKLDSVSVNENNHVVIGWTLQTGITDGFIEIHRQLDGGTFAPITQLPLTQTQYIDQGVNAQNKSYAYFVVARHTDTGSTIAISDEVHHTIFLANVQYDVCGRIMVPAWQNYHITTSGQNPQPLPVPFDSTKVWVSLNGNEFEERITLPFGQEQMLLNFQQEGRYCIKLRSFHSETQISTTSNRYCLDVAFAPVPEGLKFTSLSVDARSEGAEVTLEAANNADDITAVLLRYDPKEDDFVLVDTLSFAGNSVEYYHENPMVNQRSEKYKIHVLDSCLSHAYTLGPVSTLFAEANVVDDLVYEIRWNPYDGWPMGAFRHIIRRSVGNGEWEDIAFTDGNTTSYLDDMTTQGEETSLQSIRYHVMSEEYLADNEFPQEEASVISNTVTLKRSMEVFIPNAFNPESAIAENRIFKPVFVNFIPAEYSLSIFNRWGERFFTSGDPYQGWDGSHGTTRAASGVYSWVVKYTDSEGQSHEKAGTVLLIRN